MLASRTWDRTSGDSDSSSRLRKGYRSSHRPDRTHRLRFCHRISVEESDRLVLASLERRQALGRGTEVAILRHCVSSITCICVGMKPEALAEAASKVALASIY